MIQYSRSSPTSSKRPDVLPPCFLLGHLPDPLSTAIVDELVQRGSLADTLRHRIQCGSEGALVLLFFSLSSLTDSLSAGEIIEASRTWGTWCVVLYRSDTLLHTCWLIIPASWTDVTGLGLGETISKVEHRGMEDRSSSFQGRIDYSRFTYIIV